MISQLIFNTLVACQPKVSNVKGLPEVMPTNSEMDSSSTLMDSDKGIQQEPVAKWPPMLPPPIGLADLPPVKPTSIPLRYFSSVVLLSELSQHRLAFENHLDANAYNFMCKSICSINSDLSYYESLTNIDGCQLDLIANWKEVIDAVEHQGRDSLLDQLNVQVGVVECTADVVMIMKGRAATRPTQCQEMDDDWGGYFAALAQEEATAVFAFEELLIHLKAWDAPVHLQEWCTQIIQDEQRHALMMSGLAYRNGQESALVHFPKQSRVSLKEMALHNALTGCVGETWSAVELMYQSEQAPKYNAVFKRIAQDETTHAEFSWALHDWLMSKLSDTDRTEVADAMTRMLAVSPPAKCDSAISMGEMDAATLERAWRVFAQQVETMVDVKYTAST